jgi:predicted ATP-grasp superfamily ATP-dependent carboligase
MNVGRAAACDNWTRTTPEMKTSLLLVTTSTRWYGAARIPRSLADAGFEVSLLAPAQSLAEKSRYIARVGHLPDAATARQWIFAFAAMVKACSPRLVVPGDDTALRLLQMLVLAPPPDMQPALKRELATLVQDSLGEPAGYRPSIDKLQLPAAAESLGVRVAPYAQVADAPAALEFAAEHRFPVVLKRQHSTAGEGVAICADQSEITRAFATLTDSMARDFDGAAAGGLLVQAFVDGPIAFYPAAAWKGELLTGYAAERLAGDPEPKGPATVNRYHRSPALREMATALAKGFGMTGFFALECVMERRSGTPHLLEINRRIVANTHRGSAYGVDPCQALFAALHGLPRTTRADFDDGEEHIGVHFPQEWLRDPGSRWLRDYPVDVPWEEPELLEALVALRHTG